MSPGLGAYYWYYLMMLRLDDDDEEVVGYVTDLLKELLDTGQSTTVRLTSNAIATLELAELQKLYAEAASLTLAIGEEFRDSRVHSRTVDDEKLGQLKCASIKAWEKIRDGRIAWADGIAQYVRAHLDQFSVAYLSVAEEVAEYDVNEFD